MLSEDFLRPQPCSEVLIPTSEARQAALGFFELRLSITNLLALSRRLRMIHAEEPVHQIQAQAVLGLLVVLGAKHRSSRRIEFWRCLHFN